jgi:hypothetical protein
MLAVSPPRIDARAYLKGGCLRRFCRRRNFVRQCSRVILADSPLKTELPGVLKGLNFGASRGKACFDIRQLVYYKCDSKSTFELILCGKQIEIISIPLRSCPPKTPGFEQGVARLIYVWSSSAS